MKELIFEEDEHIGEIGQNNEEYYNYEYEILLSLIQMCSNTQITGITLIDDDPISVIYRALDYKYNGIHVLIIFYLSFIEPNKVQFHYDLSNF